MYAELGYSILFNIIFTILFIRKVRKLDKLGENLSVTIPRSVWIKFAILLLLILLQVLHLILSYASQTYWSNGYANFSLTVFLFVTNYTMQSYIVLKLVSKGSGKRYIPNMLFWIYCMISSLTEVIVVEVLISFNPSCLFLTQNFHKLSYNFSLVSSTLVFSSFRSSLIKSNLHPTYSVALL